MEKFPTNEGESNLEKVTEEALISLAKERPLKDPVVEKMLIQWLEDTRISERERENVPSVNLVEVAIKHSVMKYRLGFLSKDEVMLELEQAGGCLASERIDTKKQHAELSQIMYDIEDGVIDVVAHK